MRPWSLARRPYVPTFGPESVSCTDVMTTLACAVEPSAAVAVTVAVNLPGPYWCWATGPSATAWSPKSQWYETASPLAVRVTASGAGPTVGLACTLTIGFACAGAAQTKKTASTGARRRIGEG